MALPGQRAGLWRGLVWFALSVVLAATPAGAQQAATADPPPKINELIQLLRDPAVQAWLQHAQTVPPAPADAAPESATNLLAERQTEIRRHIQTMIATVPLLPGEFTRAGEILARDLLNRGLLLLLIAFLVLGFGVEWVFRRATIGISRWIAGQPIDTIGRRLRVLATRFALGAGAVASFAAGSIGVFLALEWPPLLQKLVLGFLAATLILRLALAIARFLFAPDSETLRVVPMTSEAARFWTRRVGWFVGWFVFGIVLLDLLRFTLGFSPEARQVLAYLLGLGLLAIACESVWRRPLPQAASGTGALPGQTKRRVIAVLFTLYFTALWAMWVVSAMRLFWLCLFAVMLPIVLRIVRRALAHLLRPGEGVVGEAALPPVYAIGVVRAVNAALIIASVLLLAHLLKIDLAALSSRDTLITRLAGGLLNAVVIVLLADLAWHVVKAMIDRRMSETQETGLPATDDARRRQRIRTLLPIVRNMLFIVVIVITALMVLAAMGVEIGPLVAGAGVVGVAVGFGAQTLVRDVISGMFYLLDDAFRIGEYIQSGNYKGTVESFSLRSVKLRHHRGPLYTVPFGQLGAVQNMSRDWVIDKLMVRVTYDSNLDVAKKLIKKIGTDLAANPEYASDIISPMKMQGIDQFGDYAIEIRMKMTTKPGQQFTIRRRALSMIKQAFDANGIKFAVPTVQVAGDTTLAAAAAVEAARLARPAEAT